MVALADMEFLRLHGNYCTCCNRSSNSNNNNNNATLHDNFVAVGSLHNGLKTLLLHVPQSLIDNAQDAPSSSFCGKCFSHCINFSLMLILKCE